MVPVLLELRLEAGEAGMMVVLTPVKTFFSPTSSLVGRLTNKLAFLDKSPPDGEVVVLCWINALLQGAVV